MPRAISTYLFRDTPLGANILDQIAKAGFDGVEIFASRRHFDYTNPNHVREVAGWFADSPVKLQSVHAPLSRSPEGTSPHSMVSIAFLERQRREDSMDEIKRVLELAERVPFRFLIAHLGTAEEEFDLRKFDAALTSLEHLCLFAGQRGVEILLENIPNDLSTPARLVEFRRHTHMSSMRFCFDSGHAQMDGDVEESIRLLGDMIASTHLHDNGGTRDEHRFPYEGIIPWEKAIRGLRAACPEAPLVLEIRRGGQATDDLEKAVKVMDKLNSIPQESSGD